MSDAKQRQKAKGKRIRSKLDGLAEGLFPHRPFQGAFQNCSEMLKMKVEAMRKQRAQGQSGKPQQALTKVKERFGNLKGFGFFQPQPQEPQLSPEEIAVLQEHQKQLAEDAEKRKKAELAKKKREKDADDLRRAREKMSVHVGGL